MRVTDVEGGQVADLVCFSQRLKNESFSAGKTLDYNVKLFLTVGDILYSLRSRPMMTITADTLGGHTCLNAPCSREMIDTVSDHLNDPVPNCLDNLSKALYPFGIHGSQIGTPFNLFMNIEIKDAGEIFGSPTIRLDVRPARSKAGEYIELKAEMDLIVGLSACPHDRFITGQPKPVDVLIFASQETNDY